MKEFFTIKNVLIIIAVIYVITFFERLLNTTNYESEFLLEHQSEKINLQNEIFVLVNKINNYEKIILQNRTDINNMSSSERDSTRNLLNPR